MRYIVLTFFFLSINLLSFSQPEPSEVLVSTEWLAENIREASLIILHVAAIRDDYAREHIPGARFLWNGWIAESNPERSYELPDAEKLDTLLEGLGISYNSRIVIYNDLQDAAAAARAYITLEYLGMGNRTSILDGGFEKWKNEAKPVTREIPPLTRGKFSPQLKPGVFIDVIEVIAKSESSGSKIVDGRSKQGYNSGGTGIFRPGHIAGAMNIPSTSLFDSTGRYLPIDSLRTIFSMASINTGDEIIAYCYSGKAACPVYVAARILNHSAHLYDGSFEEWSRKTELPVESGKSVH